MSTTPGAPGAGAGSGEEVPGFELIERIGQGGFSVVYRARQKAVERTVALKVLPLSTPSDRDLGRFRREVQFAGRLTGHPNVATVLDAGTTRSGHPYIAMELYERGSLGDRLEREGPLPVGDVLQIGVKVAAALAAAHGAGVIHRDVKPANVLVSRYGEPVLADFGIAQLLGAVNASVRSEAITPYHTAPEVVEGRSPSAASDIYSLGSTLYELLAGRPAFQRGRGDGYASVVLRVLSEEPAEIPRPDLPAPVMAVIRQSMAKRPEQRFPDAPAIAARLQSLQEELGLPVTHLPEDQRAAHLAPERATGDAPAADLDQTVIRPGRQPDRPRAEQAPSRRGWLAALAVVVVGAGIGVGFGASRLAVGTRSHPTPPPTTPAVPQGLVDAARPTELTVVDNGTSATLHWRLAPGNRFPLFVDRATSSFGESPPSPLPTGSTSTTVDGLDPARGYCFTVGAVVAFRQPAAVVAWAVPACIRGASARPPG